MHALEDGSTAIVAASSGGYQEIVRLLAEHDKDCLSVRFKNGSTPLMTAALNGYVSVVRVLLEYGMEVNSLNNDKWSALTVAAQKGCLSISKELLAHGAEVDVCSEKGFTPLMYAVKAGHVDIAKELLANRAQVNHFTLSEDKERIDKAAIPLLYGYLTPLMLAINQGDLSMVELLLEHGANLNLDLAQLMTHSVQPVDKYSAKELEDVKRQVRLAEEKERALKAAGQLEPTAKNISLARDVRAEVDTALRRLEEFEEEHEAQENSLREATFLYTYFSTPFLLAIYWNNQSVVQLLLKYEKMRVQMDATNGVYVRIIDQNNAQDMSPLQIAVDYFYIDIILLLLRNGAKFSGSEDTWRQLKLMRRLAYHWQFSSLFQFFRIRLQRNQPDDHRKLKTD